LGGAARRSVDYNTNITMRVKQRKAPGSSPEAFAHRLFPADISLQAKVDQHLFVAEDFQITRLYYVASKTKIRRIRKP
jgi:hypothetical protein